MKKSTITIIKFCLVCVLLTLFLYCSKDDAPANPYTPEPPELKYASFTMVPPPICGYTGYGCCKLTGIVKNVGQATGYNVGVEFQAYNAYNIIIDTAYGFPADLGNIPVGVSATFEAIFFELYDWTLIAKYEYEITWLTVSGAGMTQTGTIR